MNYQTFLNKNKGKHNEEYEYPYFDKEDEEGNIDIKCPKHGMFKQNIYAHVKGQGCPHCANNQLWTTEKYIEKLEEKFGKDRYDTKDCIYKGKRNKVILYCHEKFKDGTEHGKLEVYPLSFLNSVKGCKYCGKGVKELDKPKQINKPLERNEKTIEKEKKLIEKFKIIHNNFYTYDNFVLYGSKFQSLITCPIHGDFKMSANNHLKGHGCPYCAGNAKLTTETFIKKSNIKHNYFYDYTNVKKIKNCNAMVTVICPEHGEFTVSVTNHLRGVGCSACAKNRPYTTKTFISAVEKVHGNTFDLSKITYQKSNKKVIVTCPVHGDFEILAGALIQGEGCAACRQSHLEREIDVLLTDNNLNFIRQKHFPWLGKQSLDFYLPEYNIAIECQGEQHFRPVTQFGGKDGFTRRLELDINKNKLCNIHNVLLLYYWNYYLKNYTDTIFSNIYSRNNIFTNKLQLLEIIKGAE